jgi:hypothetical protein
MLFSFSKLAIVFTDAPLGIVIDTEVFVSESELKTENNIIQTKMAKINLPPLFDFLRL